METKKCKRCGKELMEYEIKNKYIYCAWCEVCINAEHREKGLIYA